MHHFAQIDPDTGTVLHVFAQSSAEPDPALPNLVSLPNWQGWRAGQRVRLVQGQEVWEPAPLSLRQASKRAERDRRLASTDWVALRAIEQGQAVPGAWASYRQALRDVPDQAGFPDAIDWPTPPT